jgi:hypothetical protein
MPGLWDLAEEFGENGCVFKELYLLLQAKRE